MNLKDAMTGAAKAVDEATPGNMKPVGQVHPSTPFKWSVAALIGALVAVFGLTCYVVWTMFGTSQWPHVESVVLAQLSNQRAVALALLALLGIQILAVVYAATSATFSGSIGLASFHMGGAGERAEPPTPVATVTVSAPAGSTAEVATGMQDEVPVADEPEAESVAPALPLSGASPSKYGD